MWLSIINVPVPAHSIDNLCHRSILPIHHEDPVNCNMSRLTCSNSCSNHIPHNFAPVIIVLDSTMFSCSEVFCCLSATNSNTILSPKIKKRPRQPGKGDIERNVSSTSTTLVVVVIIIIVIIVISIAIVVAIVSSSADYSCRCRCHSMDIAIQSTKVLPKISVIFTVVVFNVCSQLCKLSPECMNLCKECLILLILLPRATAAAAAAAATIPTSRTISSS